MRPQPIEDLPRLISTGYTKADYAATRSASVPMIRYEVVLYWSDDYWSDDYWSDDYWSDDDVSFIAEVPEPKGRLLC